MQMLLKATKRNPLSLRAAAPLPVTCDGAEGEPSDVVVTTGTVVVAVMTTYDTPEMTVGLPLSPGSWAFTATVVGGITTCKVPSTTVVDPGNVRVTSGAWFGVAPIPPAMADAIAPSSAGGLPGVEPAACEVVSGEGGATVGSGAGSVVIGMAVGTESPWVMIKTVDSVRS